MESLPKGGEDQHLKHREILGLPATKIPLVDHADRNGLNNRRSNLRVATRTQNNANSRLPSHNSSGLKGVRFHLGRFEASISVGNRQKYLGRFKTKHEAAIAYDSAALSLRGEFALTNAKLGLL